MNKTMQQPNGPGPSMVEQAAFVNGVTYRHAAGYRRLANGQLVNLVDKMRDIPGKQRKKLRRIKREEQQLLEIEKGME